ncbi:MAG: hypothetical protein MJZ64_00205 [Paludibacteraceae bacterium]|nr:hypothetical protein [Paludibacteraceae bacterium]
MAKTTFITPIDVLTGKLNKQDDSVFRQKQFKDENGKVLGVGAKETYVLRNPRDWKKHPAQGAELRKINLWKQACSQTKLITRKPEDINNDLTLSDEAKAQALATLAMWKKRFDAQRIKGEKDAPISPTTGKHLCYQRFDCFVRAALLRELQKGE